MADDDKDLGTRIAEIADELRAIAANGLHYSVNEYDEARYHRLRDLAAELLAGVDSRPVDEIASVFRGDLRERSPFVYVDAAVFNPDGKILMVERSDSKRWCLPGGAADVGESAAAAAVRESREETGLEVKPIKLVGIYDNRQLWSPDTSVHAYYVVFACEAVGGELTTSNETSDLRWMTQPEALEMPLFRSHGYKLTEAFRVYRGQLTQAGFQ